MPRDRLYQFRRGTAAQWASVNPTLDEGEPGHEYDTGRLKIGDGATPWATLAYVNLSGVVMTSDQRMGRTYSSPKGRVSDATTQTITTAFAQLTLATIDSNKFGYDFWTSNAFNPNPALNYREPTDATNPGQGARLHTLSLQLATTRAAPAAINLAGLLGVIFPAVGSVGSSETLLRYQVRVGSTVVAADTRMIVAGSDVVTFTLPVSIDSTWGTTGATLWLATNAGTITVNSKRLDVARLM